MEKGEEYYTLRFNEQEFRSYPTKNLRKEVYQKEVYPYSPIEEIKKTLDFIENDFRNKKDNKLKRFKDFSSYKSNSDELYDNDELEWAVDDILNMLNYLAKEIEKLKNK